MVCRMKSMQMCYPCTRKEYCAHCCMQCAHVYEHETVRSGCNCSQMGEYKMTFCRVIWEATKIISPVGYFGRTPLKTPPWVCTATTKLVPFQDSTTPWTALPTSDSGSCDTIFPPPACSLATHCGLMLGAGTGPVEISVGLQCLSFWLLPSGLTIEGIPAMPLCCPPPGIDALLHLSWA